MLGADMMTRQLDQPRMRPTKMRRSRKLSPRSFLKESGLEIPLLFKHRQVKPPALANSFNESRLTINRSNARNADLD